MAIPAKRRIGTMVKWLGFMPSPMHGLVLFQRNKLARATHAILETLAGRTTVDRYRSLLGFLEHLKLLLDHPRRRMYGLYRPLRSGQEVSTGPATIIRIDDHMRTSLKIGCLRYPPRQPRRLRLPSPGPAARLSRGLSNSFRLMHPKMVLSPLVWQGTTTASTGNSYILHLGAFSPSMS